MALRLSNHVVPIVGTDVTAYLAEMEGGTWIYSLWAGEGDDEALLSGDALELAGIRATPDQVARMAYLLDVEYSTP